MTKFGRDSVSGYDWAGDIFTLRELFVRFYRRWPDVWVAWCSNRWKRAASHHTPLSRDNERNRRIDVTKPDSRGPGPNRTIPFKRRTRTSLSVQRIVGLIRIVSGRSSDDTGTETTDGVLGSARRNVPRSVGFGRISSSVAW